MDAKEILEHARDALTVRRVFGDPIEKEGVLIVPVARVMGGAGSEQTRRCPDKGQGEGRDSQALLLRQSRRPSRRQSSGRARPSSRSCFRSGRSARAPSPAGASRPLNRARCGRWPSASLFAHHLCSRASSVPVE